MCFIHRLVVDAFSILSSYWSMTHFVSRLLLTVCSFALDAYIVYMVIVNNGMHFTNLLTVLEEQYFLLSTTKMVFWLYSSVISFVSFL